MWVTAPNSAMTNAQEIILTHLRNMETEKGIRILFAVESGSRMWGFASSDSDYDVRFVYVQKDLKVYNSFDHYGTPYTDTIQRMTDDRLYDFSGWDLPKFLRHLRTVNLTVVEWITSPIVYIDEGLRETVASFVRDNTAFRLLIPAHRGMLLSQKASGIENVKRAMYTARSLLALRVLQSNDRMPRDFTWNELIETAALDPEEREMFDTLHSLKVQSVEKSTTLPDDIRTFLEAERQKYRDLDIPSVRGLAITAGEKGVLDHLWRTFTTVI